MKGAVGRDQEVAPQKPLEGRIGLRSAPEALGSLYLVSSVSYGAPASSWLRAPSFLPSACPSLPCNSSSKLSHPPLRPWTLKLPLISLSLSLPPPRPLKSSLTSQSLSLTSPTSTSPPPTHHLRRPTP